MCTHLSTPWYLYLLRLRNACGGMYPIFCEANLQARTTDVRRGEHCQLNSSSHSEKKKPVGMTCSCHIWSHADHGRSRANRISKPHSTTGITGISTRSLAYG